MRQEGFTIIYKKISALHGGHSCSPRSIPDNLFVICAPWLRGQPTTGPPHCSRGCKIILSFHLLFKPCWWWWWGGDGTRRLVQGSYIRGIPATHCLLKFKSAAMLCQPNKQKRIGERDRKKKEKRQKTGFNCYKNRPHCEESRKYFFVICNFTNNNTHAHFSD